jgi:predicted ribosome quality control (RQC) complex YloA/Tae2 family protein
MDEWNERYTAAQEKLAELYAQELLVRASILDARKELQNLFDERLKKAPAEHHEAPANEPYPGEGPTASPVDGDPRKDW